MSRAVLAAWIVAGLCAIGAIGVAVVQPIHWKRTVAVVAVVGVIAAAAAIYQSRRDAIR